MSELTVLLYDSAVLCWFNFFEDEARNHLWSLIKAVTGWEITPEEWYRTSARRIIHIQRVALLLGGPDVRWNPKIDDDLPPRWYEPLKAGPYAGKAVDRELVEEAKREYYEAIGWDENGVPKSEELRRLGLEEVDRKAEALRG
ncbi:MAG: aldehyde:ferredoxin oxidoreductase [Candidatus Bathyarchaeota archaeon B26-1]|nr:MAG: aldehyde:ferredoxin oxidoreductase [Candidatus Bathyarchaeota archaeon B26-1]